MDNLTFIGFSFIGFIIIFVLLLILPRFRVKKSDPSNTQHSPRPPRQQETSDPKRVVKI